MNRPADTPVRVWDPVVRIGHWTIVIAFFVAYFTEEDLLIWHVWAGYVLGGVVVFRILWGFVGTEHARFRDFVYAPARVLSYLRDLVRLRAARYLGHSPAGGAMVLLLLLGLTITVGSGLILYAVDENAGPLAGLVAVEPDGDERAGSVTGNDTSAGGTQKTEPGVRRSSARKSVKKEAEEFWEELHELAANITLALVFLHVGGVILASIAHRENLVRAMLTGRKRKGPAAELRAFSGQTSRDI